MMFECPKCKAKYTIVVYDRLLEKGISCVCGTKADEFIVIQTVITHSKKNSSY